MCLNTVRSWVEEGAERRQGRSKKGGIEGSRRVMFRARQGRSVWICLFAFLPLSLPPPFPFSSAEAWIAYIFIPARSPPDQRRPAYNCSRGKGGGRTSLEKLELKRGKVPSLSFASQHPPSNLFLPSTTTTPLNPTHFSSWSPKNLSSSFSPPPTRLSVRFQPSLPPSRPSLLPLCEPFLSSSFPLADHLLLFSQLVDRPDGTFLSSLTPTTSSRTRFSSPSPPPREERLLSTRALPKLSLRIPTLPSS